MSVFKITYGDVHGVKTFEDDMKPGGNTDGSQSHDIAKGDSPFLLKDREHSVEGITGLYDELDNSTGRMSDIPCWV